MSITSETRVPEKPPWFLLLNERIGEGENSCLQFSEINFLRNRMSQLLKGKIRKLEHRGVRIGEENLSSSKEGINLFAGSCGLAIITTAITLLTVYPSLDVSRCLKGKGAQNLKINVAKIVLEIDAQERLYAIKKLDVSSEPDSNVELLTQVYSICECNSCLLSLLKCAIVFWMMRIDKDDYFFATETDCKKQWEWMNTGQVSECEFQTLLKSDASDLLKGSWIVVAGESQSRLMAVSLLELVMGLKGVEKIRGDLFKRHRDYSIMVEEIGMKLDFVYFMQPTKVEIISSAEVVKEELFAPVLYVMKFQTPIQTPTEAIEINDSVLQGLSSSIFTCKPEIIFKWLGPVGSDCSIVNVNIPTDGALIERIPKNHDVDAELEWLCGKHVKNKIFDPILNKWIMRMPCGRFNRLSELRIAWRSYKWNGLPDCEGSWKFYDDVNNAFPYFHLEDKVKLKGEGDDRLLFMQVHKRRSERAAPDHSQTNQQKKKGCDKHVLSRATI